MATTATAPARSSEMQPGESVAPRTHGLRRTTQVAQVALLAGSVWALFFDDLLAPVFVATLLLVVGLRSTVAGQQTLERSFVLAFASGNVLSMVYANWAYVALTDLPQYGDHTDSMWLTIGLVAASFLGTRLLELVWRLRLPSSSATIEGNRRGATLIVTGVAYVAITGTFFGASLDNRWTGEHASGVSYVASGLSRYGLPFIFVLGARLTPGLGKPRNVVLVGTGALLSGLELLTGYRERAMLSLFALGTGAWSASNHHPRLKRELAIALLVALPVVAIVFQTVGAVRHKFAFKSATERIASISEGLSEDKPAVPSGGDEASDEVISRVFEVAGQDVIARVKNTGHRAGFEYFERVPLLMVPTFIVPNQPPAETGPETLARDFHYYRISGTNSVPITLVADCYRRGGWLWIVVVGLLAGVWLRLLPAATAFFVGGPLSKIAVALVAIDCIRYYPMSVLGLTSAVTWHWSKTVIVFVALSMAISALDLVLRARSADVHRA